MSDSYALLTNRLQLEKHSFVFQATVLNQHSVWAKNLLIPIQIFNCVAVIVKQYSSVCWKKTGRGERSRGGEDLLHRTSPRESNPFACVCVCVFPHCSVFFFCPCEQKDLDRLHCPPRCRGCAVKTGANRSDKTRWKHEKTRMEGRKGKEQNATASSPFTLLLAGTMHKPIAASGTAQGPDCRWKKKKEEKMWRGRR